MKKSFFILLFSIFIACSTNKQLLEKDGNNISHQPLVNYQKLNKKKINKFFKLETNKHRLGQITFFNYFPSGNIKKETTYKNKKGKLVFYYESGYKYADNDSLIYKYDYNEIPSYKTPELSEYNYFYPSDSLSIIVQKIDKQIDSLYIVTSRDSLGKIIKKLEKTKITHRGKKQVKIKITNYFYDASNRLIKKITIDEKYRDTLQSNYTYSNNKLTNYLYQSGDYIYEKKYVNGLLDIEKTSHGDGDVTIDKYSYDSQNREILKQKFKNESLVYSYNTFYNKIGLISKYEMINEKDEKSGIWLYEYNKNGKLKYKVNLYARE